MALAQFEWAPTSVDYATAWTTTPANYDILANDPGKLRAIGLGMPSEGRPCRWITCGVAGTIVVTRIDGVNVTLDATQVGQTFYVQAIALVNTSTAQKVSVYW